MVEENKIELIKWDINQSLEHIKNFKGNASTLIGISGVVMAIIVSSSQIITEKRWYVQLFIASYFLSFVGMIVLLIWFHYPKEAITTQNKKCKKSITTQNKKSKKERKILELSYDSLVEYRKILRKKVLPRNAKYFSIMTWFFAANMILGTVLLLLLLF